MRKPIRVSRSPKKSVKVSSDKKVTSKRGVSSVSRRVASKAGVTGYKGSAGFEQGKVEKKRGDEQARKRNIPWDFFISAKNGDHEKDSILLDKEAYFMYEHTLQDSTGNWTSERCIRDQGNCPLCSKLGKEGAYVLKLSCIDLTPYEKKDGTKMKATKRIMTVKTQQLPKFQRLYEANGGSFRGIKLHHIRDDNKQPRIGGEIERVGKLSEEKLAKYGKDLNSPLKFNEIYPDVSEKELANKWGAARALGASNFDEDDDEDEDGEGW